VLKGDLIFADEEGVFRGHPQAWTVVPLRYFLGCVGIPNLELLSILHLISSFSNPYAFCGTVDVNHRPVGNPKRKV
jgi:hypothetical protein